MIRASLELPAEGGEGEAEVATVRRTLRRALGLGIRDWWALSVAVGALLRARLRFSRVPAQDLSVHLNSRNFGVYTQTVSS